MAKTPTQRERILSLLVTYPEGVCSTDLLREHLPRAAARIHEMRADGYLIFTEACDKPGHNHTTPQVKYRIEWLQPSLLGGFCDE